MATEPVRNDKVVPEPVISLNSRSPKAYYRAGFALLVLNRGHDALDVYGRTGDGATSCGGFKALRRRVEKECDELRKREDECPECGRTEEKWTWRSQCDPILTLRRCFLCTHAWLSGAT